MCIYIYIYTCKCVYLIYDMCMCIYVCVSLSLSIYIYIYILHTYIMHYIISSCRTCAASSSLPVRRASKLGRQTYLSTCDVYL